MIRVIRSPKPPILVSKEVQWVWDLRLASTSGEKKRALVRYRHRQVREALVRMFHGKCAYCESEIGHVSDAHIEHYRPKARFPHLTFDWDNLLLACGICNASRYKGDRFPEASEGGPLLNPCVDLPDNHFTFHYDATARR